MINVNDRVHHVIAEEWGEVIAIDDTTGFLIVLWDKGFASLTEPMDINKTKEGRYV